MAVTESPGTQPGSGDPPGFGPSPRSRARIPWRRWAPATLTSLVVAALVVLTVLAWTYQPIPPFSGEGGGSFPGLPAGTGLRVVNTFGTQTGQLYVPPQSGAFTVVEGIQNTGPEAVTIEAVSILGPQQQAMIRDGAPTYPLIPAGQALGWIETWRSPLPAARPVARPHARARPGDTDRYSGPAEQRMLHQGQLVRGRRLLREGTVPDLHPLGGGPVRDPPAVPGSVGSPGTSPGCRLPQQVTSAPTQRRAETSTPPTATNAPPTMRPACHDQRDQCTTNSAASVPRKLRPTHHHTADKLA